MIFNSSNYSEFTPEEKSVGLRASLTILKKWGCSKKQIQSILSIQHFNANSSIQDKSNQCSLTDEQLKRISFVLSIHATLRTVFTNPKNIYGFMSMDNHNGYFLGASPLEVICRGDLLSLSEVCYQISIINQDY